MSEPKEAPPRFRRLAGGIVEEWVRGHYVEIREPQQRRRAIEWLSEQRRIVR